MEETTIQEIRDIQLNILNDVHTFCQANNIRYFLAWGTLLGAIRHDGYIPWDDDIDISMPRPDYDRFIRLYKSDRYVLDSILKDSSYPYVFAKVSDKHTILVEETRYPYNLGINIDVFPIDGLSNDRSIAIRHNNKITFYNKILTFKRVRMALRRGVFKNLLLFIGQLILCLIPYKWLLRILDKNMRKYDFEQSKYAADLCFAEYGKISERKLYEKYNLHVFENNMYVIPDEYHSILTHIYGDYMTLPPAEKRISHHIFKAYKCKK